VIQLDIEIVQPAARDDLKYPPASSYDLRRSRRNRH
jgi:hypothetical protein